MKQTIGVNYGNIVFYFVISVRLFDHGIYFTMDLFIMVSSVPWNKITNI